MYTIVRFTMLLIAIYLKRIEANICIHVYLPEILDSITIFFFFITIIEILIFGKSIEQIDRIVIFLYSHNTHPLQKNWHSVFLVYILLYIIKFDTYKLVLIYSTYFVPISSVHIVHRYIWHHVSNSVSPIRSHFVDFHRSKHQVHR